VANLPLCADDLIRRLRAAWGADGPPPSWPEALVEHLIAERFGRADWVRRR